MLKRCTGDTCSVFVPDQMLGCFPYGLILVCAKAQSVEMLHSHQETDPCRLKNNGCLDVEPL